LQLNATTNPQPNLNPIANPNLKTNPNFTLKSEDLNLVVFRFQMPACLMYVMFDVT